MPTRSTATAIATSALVDVTSVEVPRAPRSDDVRSFTGAKKDMELTGAALRKSGSLEVDIGARTARDFASAAARGEIAGDLVSLHKLPYSHLLPSASVPRRRAPTP